MNRLTKYKNWLTVNGLSANTIRAYCTDIDMFFNKFTKLTKDNVEEFILKLYETHSKSTINRYINSIKSYCKFLNLPIELPRSARVEERLPEYITEECFRNEIIPVCEGVCEKSLRNKAILYFMFYTGVRINELVSLKREDIDLEKCLVKVYRQKSKKERIIPFTKLVSDILKCYFASEPNPKNDFNVSQYAVCKLFKTLKTKLVLKVRFHPHLLRHSFATMLRDKGFPIEDIQYLLGHASIQTTMRYAHVNPKNLIEKYHNKLNEN